MSSLQLCEACKVLQLNSVAPLPLHTTASAVRYGAGKHCAVCCTIMEGLRRCNDEPGSPMDDFYDDDIVVLPSQLRRPMQVLFASQMLGRSRTVQFFYSQETDSLALQLFGRGSHVELDSSSAAFFRKFKLLLDMCMRSHESCGPMDKYPQLPDRVVDIGPANTQLRPRLILTGGLSAPYVVLSHCWGAKQTYITTSSNIGQRLAGLSLEEMPLTFRDAITATRALGFRYIWIDSLCILQDDSHDWDCQSAKMSDIFAEGSLTIAASLAPGDSAGFFGLRSRSVSKCLQRDPRYISRSSNDPQLDKLWANLWVREQLSHETFGGGSQDPLFTRAWVLQELLLSKRILSLGTLEAQWYCKEAYICECDASAGGSLALETGILLKTRTDLSLGQRSYVSWYRIVEIYTALNLTVSNDRLPALSALASLFARELQSSYIAGLWRADIGDGINWQVARVSPGIGGLPNEYRAPSWSWASIDGAVTFDSSAPGHSGFESPLKFRVWGETDSHVRTETIPAREEITATTTSISESAGSFRFTVHQATCEAEGVNKFGRVRGGVLRLTANIVEANLFVPALAAASTVESLRCEIRLPGNTQRIKHEARTWSFLPDVPLAPSILKKESAEKLSLSVRRSRSFPNHGRVGFLGKVWLLPLTGWSYMVLGIPSPDLPKDTFERIGVWQRDVRSESPWKQAYPVGESRTIAII